ncbi:MAG: hypothetical protein AAF726_16180 [Planctomycetota bacterium]
MNDDSGLPKERLWQPVTGRWFFAVFGTSLVYAIVRYHLAGDVPWAHFPLFILNKATALSAVLFVASSYLVGPVFRWHNGDPVIRLVVVKFCGLGGFFLAGMHAFMSLCLLRPAYFAKYFADDGRLNVVGEVAMVTGIAGLYFLMSPAITTLPMMPKALGGVRWKRAQRAGYIAIALTLGHLVALGWEGWMNPSGWNGGLPPISLLAAIGALVPLVVKLRRER